MTDRAGIPAVIGSTITAGRVPGIEATESIGSRVPVPGGSRRGRSNPWAGGGRRQPGPDEERVQPHS